MPGDAEVLARAIQFLNEEVAPYAQRIDQDPEALRGALDGLGKLDFLALKRPGDLGGPGVNEATFRDFQEEVARTSGALAFLQTQHQSAGSMLRGSDNRALVEEYLPKMGSGERLVGIGFSQLRRGGPPIMRATETAEGYRLNGHVPWVTGWDFYPEFLIGATLPDGRAVFGVVPLVTGPGVTVSSTMQLAAMESANTVTVDFSDFLLEPAKVAFVRPATWARDNDQINIALQGHFAIGCARGGLDILWANAEKKNLDFLFTAHAALLDELNRCRQETLDAQQDASEETTEARLQVRAWAIDLAVRCAHAAVTSTSGAANSVNHPAQRVYREALVYTVSAQTVPIMEATLRRLTRLP